MTDIMHESDFPHLHPSERFELDTRSDASDIVPDPIVVPNQVAIALMTEDVLQGKGDAGASQWLTERRDSGYLVGIPSLSLTFGSPGLVDPVAVVSWVRTVAQFATDSGAVTVGSWVNPDTGAVCFDASSWHDNMAQAGTASKHRGEHSYWDIAAGKAVRTS